MRKKIVAGNWKMNKNYEEALSLASEVIFMANDEVNSNIQLVLACPFPYLIPLKKYLDKSPNIALAAQNCSNMASGAYTGEVSASMIASIEAQYVLIGHSERRQYFNETNQQLKEKVDLALANNLTPIFCCGESLELRNGGLFLEFVANQISESLFHLDANAFQKIVIAYEPIWAIGTGLTASSAQAQEMHAYLRIHIENKYGSDVANNISILYGGSCNEKNAAELFACADVDGGLIGGASLKSREFVNIAKSF
jgi:triosephosphate isomerase (TIM)